MTRKNLIRLAKVIRERPIPQQQKEDLAIEMALLLQDINPSFKFEKWMTACMGEH